MFRHLMHAMQERPCTEPLGYGREPRNGASNEENTSGWGRRGRFGAHREGGPFSRGAFGGGRERMFDNGAIRLVILKLLSDEPSYGYQLIKRLEERMAGGYTPSAGVIYPTLSMLEEQGYIAPTTNDAGKKVFSVTPEGSTFLSENKERLTHVEVLMNAAGRGFERGRSPEIMQAFMNLRGAVKAKVSREGLTPQQIVKIAEAVNAAAKAIDAL